MTDWLEKHVPKLVLAPSLIAIFVFVYGFIGWTAYVSFTKSRLLPKYDLVGPIQYEKLAASPRWEVALTNLAIFGILFILFATVIGLILAIMLDQKSALRAHCARFTSIPWPSALL